jgi:hypothetical protein
MIDAAQEHEMIVKSMRLQFSYCSGVIVRVIELVVEFVCTHKALL